MKKLFAFFFILSTALPSFAHGPNETDIHPYLVHFEQFEELEEYLNLYLTNSQRFGILVTTKEARALGERLAVAVHYQLMEMAEIKGIPHFPEQSLQYFKAHILPRLNLIKMGRVIVDVGHKLGARFAITILITELLENASFVYAAINPKFAFLIPLAAFHVYDAATYGFVFGIPAAYRKWKTIHRFGEGLHGFDRYYNFLLEQRKSLPVDWSVVTDVQKLALDGHTYSDFVILKRSLIEKYIPSKLKPYVTPNRAAQRASSNAVSINELESLAKTLGVKLYVFSGLDKSSAMYARLLIQSILAYPKGMDLLNKKIMEQNGGVYFQDFAKKPKDASDIYFAASAEGLQKTGESADILALRLLWYINHGIQELREGNQTTWSDHKILRSVQRSAMRNLQEISETEFLENNQEGYLRLILVLEEMRTKFDGFSYSPTFCKKLLSLL